MAEAGRDVNLGDVLDLSKLGDSDKTLVKEVVDVMEKGQRGIDVSFRLPKDATGPAIEVFEQGLLKSLGEKGLKKRRFAGPDFYEFRPDNSIGTTVRGTEYLMLSNGNTDGRGVFLETRHEFPQKRLVHRTRFVSGKQVPELTPKVDYFEGVSESSKSYGEKIRDWWEQRYKGDK